MLLHLSRYGIFPIEFLRTQYIAAGILALGPILLAHFALAFTHLQFEDFKLRAFPTTGFFAKARHAVATLVGIAWKVIVVVTFCNIFIVAFTSIFIPATFKDNLI